MSRGWFVAAQVRCLAEACRDRRQRAGVEGHLVRPAGPARTPPGVHESGDDVAAAGRDHLGRRPLVLAAADEGCNPSEPFPKAALRVSRGKHSGTQQVSLPEGFLDTLDDDSVPLGADDAGEDGGDGG